MPVAYLDNAQDAMKTPWPLIDEIGDELLGLRKKYIKQYEYWVSSKNSSGENIELARFSRDEASIWLKRLRACRLLIPWFANPPKDCLPVRAPSDFPKELFDELQHVIDSAEIATW